MPQSRLAHVKLLIKNGKIVNDDQMFEGDIFVEDGIIRQLGKDIIAPGGCEVINAHGMYVMPGGIDTHTHMEFYFMGSRSIDDFYTGTKAALAGGTTCILDFVSKKEAGMSLLEAYEDYRARAGEKACCDYGFHVIVNEINDQVEEEMEELVTKHGINSFKMFMAYKGSLMLDDTDLIRVFKKCSQLGAVAQVHAENGNIIEENEKTLLSNEVHEPEGHLLARHEEIEAEATNRACVLAHQVNCPLYVVHVMSKSASDVISARRNLGQVVFGETLVSALGVDGCNVKHKCFHHAAAHIMSPPLRDDPTTRPHLMNLLASGVLSCVGSDHCTFDASKKALGEGNFTKIPNGVNGVEERMPVVWELGVNRGRIDPCQFVAMTSTNAAKIFNLYPKKGRIAIGSDADIVIWDPSVVKKYTPQNHHSAVDFNIFSHITCRGGPRFVIARGRVVVNEGEMHVSQGWGKFVSMPANGQHAFTRIRTRSQLPIKPELVEETLPEVASAQGGDTPSLNGAQASAAASPAPCASPAPDSVDGAMHGNAGSSTRGSIQGTPEQSRRPSRDIFPAQPKEFYQRPLTKGGSRNLQDSSFSLSGAQIDDARTSKSSVRVQNPPGGRSHGIW